MHTVPSPATLWISYFTFALLIFQIYRQYRRRWKKLLWPIGIAVALAFAGLLIPIIGFADTNDLATMADAVKTRITGVQSDSQSKIDGLTNEVNALQERVRDLETQMAAQTDNVNGINFDKLRAAYGLPEVPSTTPAGQLGTLSGTISWSGMEHVFWHDNAPGPQKFAVEFQNGMTYQQLAVKIEFGKQRPTEDGYEIPFHASGVPPRTLMLVDPPTGLQSPLDFNITLDREPTHQPFPNHVLLLSQYLNLK